VQRYKGLGEMTATQLWETTMDPERRTCSQVKLEDIAETEAIFTTLMGEDVEARRKFIEDNALDVKNLDICTFALAYSWLARHKSERPFELTAHLCSCEFSPQAKIVHEFSTGSKNCTGVMWRCAVSPHGKKFNVEDWPGRDQPDPGLMVSQTGGAASFAQFAFGLARSASVVPPGFAVLIGYAIPSFPVAMQTPMAKMQAGPADPQSSSDHAPVAICGEDEDVGTPWSLTVAHQVCILQRHAHAAVYGPPERFRGGAHAGHPGRQRRSLSGSGEVSPRCPVIHHLQVAGFPPEGGVYFSFRNDSPH
jgi:hypothetical protein